MKISTLGATIFCLFLVLAVSAFGQQPQPAAADDLNSQIESLRADTRADKVAIITEAMKFTPQESSAFWPVYKKYESDLAKLNDGRVELIKSYAQKYTTLTDADAKQFAEQSFDLEQRRVDLKKKYFKEFNKQLPGTTVAKFFQLEHRLDLLIDLAIASQLPALLAKPPTNPAPAPQ
jgi:hypothetical protein